MIRMPVALFFALFFLALTGPAMAQANDHAVVLDSSGNVVHNSTGNCVRTQWTGAGDPCAPVGASLPPPPMPKPVATFVPPPPPPPMPAPTHHTVISEAARTVYFPFNKTDLTAKTKAQLDTLAATLKSAKDIEAAKIVGAADRIGGTKYNDELSEKRANAVRDYLIARGYANASVTKTNWVGKSEPITKCSKKLPHKKLVACLQADRRVSIEIVYKSVVTATPAAMHMSSPKPPMPPAMHAPAMQVPAVHPAAMPAPAMQPPSPKPPTPAPQAPMMQAPAMTAPAMQAPLPPMPTPATQAPALQTSPMPPVVSPQALPATPPPAAMPAQGD